MPHASPRFHSRPARQVARYLTPSMMETAASYGIQLVQIDPRQPLAAQGPFNAIIHKLPPDAGQQGPQRAHLPGRHARGQSALAAGSPDMVGPPGSLGAGAGRGGAARRSPVRPRAFRAPGGQLPTPAAKLHLAPALQTGRAT